MLSSLASGSIFFPGLFLLSKRCLKHTPGLALSEGDATIVSARLVSSIQAIMASLAGYIIASSCEDVIEDQHWLTSTYILFAVPYFVYDIYAMFLCYWHKLQVKGHEEEGGRPKPMGSEVASYLRREFLMVLHHVVMVTICFPVSVFWRQGKGDYFQGVMFMAELSTPSVCLGKILIRVILTPLSTCFLSLSTCFLSLSPPAFSLSLHLLSLSLSTCFLSLSPPAFSLSLHLLSLSLSTCFLSLSPPAFSLHLLSLSTCFLSPPAFSLHLLSLSLSTCFLSLYSCFLSLLLFFLPTFLPQSLTLRAAV
ncbi:ceramide synthase-like isoform X1 [Oncorhynchus nerka]|uniref:ceramide synthase-like isoform X1 n=1 Tax=Oncorhynchus nerka TaxID=8023 RepID=UPI0031B84CA7